MKPENNPLSRKELAHAFGCSPWYVSRAKAWGFGMPGRRATLTEFRAWLAANPLFRTGKKHQPFRFLQKPPEAST